METLSCSFDIAYLRGEKPAVNTEVAAAMRRIPEIIEEFDPTVKKNILLANSCQAASWRLLAAHGRICIALASLLLVRAQGDESGTAAELDRFSLLLWQMEEELHPVLDVWMYLRTLRRRLLDPSADFQG